MRPYAALFAELKAVIATVSLTICLATNSAHDGDLVHDSSQSSEMISSQGNQTSRRLQA